MKRTLENTIGSARSIFQPVPQKPRVDLPPYSSTLSPGLGVGQPVMKSVAPRAPVYIIFQNFSNGSSAALSPPQEAHSGFDQDHIATKAIELRTAIMASNHEVMYTILNEKIADQSALANDAQGKNALFYAIEKNDLLAMDYLLSLSTRDDMVLQKSEKGMMPLSVAAQNGSVIAVQLLLKLASAKEQIALSLRPTMVPNRANPLLQAAGNGHESVVNLLLASDHAEQLVRGKTAGEWNALMLAAYRGHEGVVKALLASEHAAELTQGSSTQSVNTLMVAAYQGHMSVVNLLLQSPLAATLLQARNKDGFNALMIAAQNGHEDVLRVLLSSDCAEVLVKQKNNEGLNALMLSAFRNHSAVTRILLEFGFVEEQLAGIYSGRSTIDNVIKLGFSAVAEVLIQYGAVATRERSKAGGQSMTPTDPSQ